MKKTIVKNFQKAVGNSWLILSYGAIPVICSYLTVDSIFLLILTQYGMVIFYSLKKKLKLKNLFFCKIGQLE